MIRLRLRELTLYATVSASILLGSLACSGSEADPDGSGGASTTGGDSGTGGAGTGGTSSGGAPSGGTGTGGAATGGMLETGGAATGGAHTGGAGGAATGGVEGIGGSTGGTDGAGGSGGSGLSLVEPIQRAADSYVLEFGETVFEVDPTRGARIVTFSHAGTNLLSDVVLDPETGFLNGGSTLWLSPQSAWDADPQTLVDWPPPTEIDSDPYTVALEGQNIVTTGDPAMLGTGAEFSVEKTFSPALDVGAIDISYSIHNVGATAASYAPWEVSRHARAGMTFWPGTEVETGEFALGPPQDGIIWWNDAAGTSSNGKVFTNGSEGWVAHVQDDLLLVKTWTDTSALAPAHGDVELYLGSGYIEIEEHGPYGEIAAGAQTTWEIRWHVHKLDPTIDVSVGSADLLELARSFVP